jgi:hypothetical protein
MGFSLKRYSNIAIFNLLLISLLGLILRYKIAFALPFIDQSHLLHGHSHFAFTGWITHALMVLLVAFMALQKGQEVLTKYSWIINANLFTAYGMLISFPLQGYGLFSISFSTLSVIVSYVFVVMYWKDLNSLPQKKVSHWWIKAALFFNVLSSAGTFALAFMMVTKSIHQNWYLASVYFYLHFQYNGWFLFACLGLATDKLLSNVPSKVLRKIFWLFAGACVPAYLLSALWLPMPAWLYILVVLAAFSQVAGWIFIIQEIKKQMLFIKSSLNKTVQWLLLFSSIAFSIKLLLQLGSTIPSLSKLAFGFHPIVIGYLHLVLLGVITLFLLGYLINEKLIVLNSKTFAGIKIFTAGIIINEVLLMTQGVAAISNMTVPFINELLFITACVLFGGISLLNVSQHDDGK